MPQPRDIEVEPYIDLRKDQWEIFQRSRAVPVIGASLIHTYAILPWHLHQEEAQLRIQQASLWYHHWQLVLLMGENWVISRAILPPDVEEVLQEYEDRRMQGSQQRRNRRQAPVIRRGGAKHSHPDPSDPIAMLCWAARKAARDAPRVPAASITVSAILNCRTPSQTRDVICAAMRRAGLAPPAEHLPAPPAAKAAAAKAAAAKAEALQHNQAAQVDAQQPGSSASSSNQPWGNTATTYQDG